MKETISRVSPKSGRTRRRPARPRASLTDKLSNLHLLLQVPSFARWPLEVRFFCKDVHRAWQRWSGRSNRKIKDGIKVILDVKQQVEFSDDCQAQPSTKAKDDQKLDIHGSGGVESLDVGYSRLKNHVQKSLDLLAEGESYDCAVCTEKVGYLARTVLVCPIEGCETVFHMTCLSKRFLNEEGMSDSVVPISGSCPHCRTTLQWIDMVKEMSLRVRGESDVARLMRRPRVHQAKVVKLVSSLHDYAMNIEDAPKEEGDYELIEDAIHTRHESEEPLAADWYHLVDDEEDVMSVASAESGQSNYLAALSPARPSLPAKKLEVVIEDSDWNNAEVLD